jgi:GNAT superfamily N-acetyltransferase
MWWRLDKGERISNANAPKMKRRQRALVLAGESRGVLAFIDGQPVGWCAYARRTELPRLSRSPALACSDAGKVWSVPCFFVKAGFRSKGVARALLRHALRSIRAQGGRIVEAYPVRPPSTNAAAFTGTVPFLEGEGFRVLTDWPRGKQRARKRLQGFR